MNAPAETIACTPRVAAAPPAASATDPLISVVTPSFNQGRFIARCIESVVAQNYPNFEHIIYDNCSTDGTPAVLRRYCHLDWVSEPDRGQSDALNKAILRSRGEIIAWLNADDYYLPGTFQRAARELQQSTGVAAIAGPVQLLDERGHIRETLVPRFEGLGYLVDFWSHPYGLCQPGVLFRREVVERVGLFRTDLHLAMDYDFWLRAAAHFQIKTIDAVLAAYVLHEDSKTERGRCTMRFWDEMERVSRRYWGPPWSLRRWRLSRRCNRYAAGQLAATLLHACQCDGEWDWSLLWRLLRRRPSRACDRHVVGALAERIVGRQRWSRVKARCGWGMAPRRRTRP